MIMWKEKLWQLFLVLILGVVLTVCNKGGSSTSNDGSVNADETSTSISSGPGWVKIDNLTINYGEMINDNTTRTVTFAKEFQNLIPIISFLGTNTGGESCLKDQMDASKTGFQYRGYITYFGFNPDEPCTIQNKTAWVAIGY